MTNRGDTNRLSAVGQLIKDSIGADPQRVEAAELPSERMAGERFTLEQPKRALYRIDERPAQLEQFMTCSSSEDKSRQRSAAGRRTTLGKLAAKLSESHGFATLELGKTRLQRGQRIRIGENLGGLL